MPRPEKFWDRVASRYSRSPIANPAAYEQKLTITRGYLGSEMQVLEIGCGTGTTAIAHAPFVKHIEAIDISEAMLDIAREKAGNAGVDNIRFVLAAGKLRECLVPFDVVRRAIPFQVGHAAGKIPDRQNVPFTGLHVQDQFWT